MADLTLQKTKLENWATDGGLEATYTACSSAGDKCAVGYDERVFFHIKNAHTATQTVTIKKKIDKVTIDGVGEVAVNDIVIPVTNAEERFSPVIPATHIGVDGKCELTYSGVTALTIAAIRLVPASRNL